MLAVAVLDKPASRKGLRGSNMALSALVDWVLVRVGRVG